MKKHVLVVDDDPCVRAVLEADLAKRGYRVSLSESQQEALLRLEAGDDDVDVILTDFQMQGASGADLCARVGDGILREVGRGRVALGDRDLLIDRGRETLGGVDEVVQASVCRSDQAEEDERP